MATKPIERTTVVPVSHGDFHWEALVSWDGGFTWIRLDRGFAIHGDQAEVLAKAALARQRI
jgi:hypothetical protein